MKYRELIKEVQDYSGFSDQESEDALQLMTELVSTHLTEGERQDFASQLPTELQDIALSVRVTKHNSEQNVIEQVMELQDIDEPHAKKQVKAVWRALKDAISPGEINDIKSQLPNDLVQMLI